MEDRRGILTAACAFLCLVPGAAAQPGAAAGGPCPCSYVVGYEDGGGLRATLARHGARVVRRLDALHAAEVRTADATGLRLEPGIRFVERARRRASAAEPGLAPGLPATGLPLEWQYAATHADAVPDWVQRAAGAVTIAVVDTGADLRAPDLDAKSPRSYDAVRRRAAAPDDLGHGTFVASLAAGSVSNGEGISGFGGDARLLVVKANKDAWTFSDVDEAAAIVWAVDHGARIVNLSFGGAESTAVERRAVEYAVSKGALLVAAAGNGHAAGDPEEYPAALLQPSGSNGAPGRGLSVGASDLAGARAPFSTAGSTVSLVAPGTSVLGAVASGSALAFQRVALPGSLAGAYGYGSGTSYAAPQVAGAAALVWGANPTLTAPQVAQVLRASASGDGSWNPDTGWGVLDVARAVELAGGTPPRALVNLDARRDGRRVVISWSGYGGVAYNVAVAVDAGAPRTLGTRARLSFPVAPGHTYTVTAEALDEAGATIAAAEPFRTSVPPLRAAVVKTPATKAPAKRFPR